MHAKAIPSLEVTRIMVNFGIGAMAMTATNALAGRLGRRRCPLWVKSRHDPRLSRVREMTYTKRKIASQQYSPKSDQAFLKCRLMRVTSTDPAKDILEQTSKPQ